MTGGHATPARTLAIDCATPALSVALFEGADCLAARHEEISRGHAEALVPAIAALPDRGRADRILVDVGPGSFTGVRVGLAAARALGFAWGVPVAGFGCLDLVAAVARARHAPAARFPVVMIGGHGELFWRYYAADASLEAQQQEPPRSTPIAALAALMPDPVVYGSGAAVLLAARGTGGEAVPLLPDARAVPLLGAARCALPAQPLYGRGADAKPMAARGAGA